MTTPNSPLTEEQKAELEAKIREAVLMDEYGFSSRGRHLGLQDVLIALEEWSRRLPVKFHNLGDSIAKHSKIEAALSVILKRYDLTKDYHHQSEEFYSFLYSLLLL